MRDGLKDAGAGARERGRKVYEKPAIRLQRDIEALTGTYEPQGMDTGQDKLMSDPNTGLCLNPLT